MDVATGSLKSSAPVLRLHHAAFRCRDGEETRHFYEDILGLPLVHVVQSGKISTGATTPFAHLFFEMHDGSCIAFFDLGDNEKAEPSPNTPAWVQHFAMLLPKVEDVHAMKARLEKHGIEVLGVTDHEFVHSIYFFDPNGLRLEFTAQAVSDEAMQGYAKEAHSALKEWNSYKAELLAEKNREVATAR